LIAGYPADLVRPHRLFDGRSVTIRPVRPDDRAAECELLSQLSEESRYLRFHEWVGTPSDKLLDFLTQVDYDRHMALVCTYAAAGGESLVGDARYVVNPDGATCEFAIMIADTWHKSGIAGLLMLDLLECARKRGLRSMEGIILRRNHDMSRFMRGLGFEITPMEEEPTLLRVCKPLHADPNRPATHSD